MSPLREKFEQLLAMRFPRGPVDADLRLALWTTFVAGAEAAQTIEPSELKLALHQENYVLNRMPSRRVLL